MDKVEFKDYPTKKLVPNHPSAFGYGEYAQIKDLEYYDYPDVESGVVEPEIEQKERLFNEIFTLNHKTKLPDGDLAIWMSKNTSPSIKQFIQDNLFSPVPLSSDGGKYDGLSDDDIALYTRGSDESLYHYRDRLVNVLKESAKKPAKK